METKRKLSELIREGAKLRPHGVGDYFTINDKGEQCSCALGAAIEALTGAYGEKAYELPDVQQGQLGRFVADNMNARAYVVHPVTTEKGSLFNAVVTLNDEYNWTREQIADWLEGEGY